MLFRAFKTLARNTLQKFGYDCSRVRFPPGQRPGIDPFNDMAYFLRGNPSPVICDVGANEGQTVQNFKLVLPSSVIHSFEPSLEVFQLLKKNIGQFDSVTAWNIGLGAEKKTMQLNENSFSTMNSFLPATHETFGTVQKVTSVETEPLDCFAAANNLEVIDVLKIDTQGYEYEVLKGARDLLKNNKIKLVYLEVTLGWMYNDLPSLTSILSYLQNNKFLIVSFYDQRHKFPERTLWWCDILFVHETVIQGSSKNRS